MRVRVCVIPLAFVILMWAPGCTRTGAGPWVLTSPTGGVKLEVSLSDASPALQYRVLRVEGDEEKEVVASSPLGLVRDDADFSSRLELIDEGKPTRVTVEYELVHGKCSRVRKEAVERVLAFRAASEARLDLVLRVFDDGVAFRYVFPEKDTSQHVVQQELTGFKIPEGSVGYLLPFDPPGQYTPAYEAYFRPEVPVGTPAPTPSGWGFPALFRIAGQAGWVLLTEADLDSSYCGSRLASEAPGGLYRLRFPDAEEGQGVGEVEPRHSLPWQTPWRVIVVGSHPGVIVESTLVTDLSRPGTVQETGWIRPGRVAWSWWSDQESPKLFERQLPFIDLASEMGWEFVLVDANWDEMGEGAVEKLVEYGRGKGVGILLWYNSGGPHNVVTEKPRDRMYDPTVREKEMSWLERVGVKGIKVDFFQSDKQAIVRLYEDILQDAARHRLMVNFHGCTLPRGWTRTYPHLMSMEAVRGAESYIFDPEYPEKAPWHNAVLPFTRNAVGPMDYTPVTFSDNRYPHLTSLGHELALSVVFESGWIHLADSAASYRSQPVEVREFLSSLPAAWDETRYLAGFPGESIVLARRRGDRWFVAGINGGNDAASMEIDLGSLGLGGKQGILITDTEDARLAARGVAVPQDGTLRIELKPRGGFVWSLTERE
ncbi:MAG TPA: glycoside hydrolase family 97 catalytic domain-containing protein [Acidobacteriota bacterium]|nr:glycoside hydrolase family 97 catalytic domain-containing protein [Acidobacteriota bacterium]